MIRSRYIALALAAACVALAGCDARSPTTAVAAEPPPASLVAAHPAADAVLAARIEEALRNDPATRDAEIQLSVSQGRVRLSGFVDSALVRLRAGMLASQTEGVTAVDNRLIQRHHAGGLVDPFAEARVHL